MAEQQATDRIANFQPLNGTSSRKGKQKQWKDLTQDPLSEGFDTYQAEYVVGKAPLSWLSLSPGQLFSRTKSGKSLYVKMNDGRAICLDTKQSIEIKPAIRPTFQVWLVTSFNSTTASKADF